MKIIQLALIVMVGVVATGCGTTTSRKHPSLDEELKHIESVVIVPPAVQVELRTLTGEDERMTEKEAELKARLTEIAKSRLTESGFEVMDFDFAAAVEENEDFAYAVTQVREGFQQAKMDLEFGRAVPESKAKLIKASVGEAANILQSMSGADAILLINYNGFDKSDGYVAKDLATGILVGVLTMGAVVPVAASSGAVTEVALLDGVSGEVLWADTFMGPLSESIGTNAMKSLPMDVDVDVDVDVAIASEEDSKAVVVSEVSEEKLGMPVETTPEE